MDATGSRPVSRDNPFGRTSAPQSVLGTNSPRPSPAAIASSSATPPPPGEKPAKVPITYTQTLPNVPPQFDREGRITSFRGQRVVWVEDPIAYVYGEPQPLTYSPCYNRPDGKGLEKIWFPKGNNEPGVTELGRKREDLEAPDDEYTEEVKVEYKYLHENGRFKDGKMPKVAPKREFVDCDF
ncbi:MAG: hypothetical protein M1823_007368 [Watsoniomyces obsoletus]|nr:MAG: hypothetical protein M1823_007368 [Watsoniomyces obsoletus]